MRLRLRRLILHAILGVDWLLRRHYRIREFTDDPLCVLRIATDEVTTAVNLPDGTRLAVGDTILVLHLWNEQSPRHCGNNLGWAARFRGALGLSLRLLAADVFADPALAKVRALRADTGFASRGRGRKLARIAAHYGFTPEFTGPGRTFQPRRRLGDDLLMFGLALACNPRSLRRRPLRRDHHRLWMSREKLLTRWRAECAPPTSSAVSARHEAA